MSQIIVAIDGHSSCGKSTLSQALAASLNYKYITSGAMYRAVTLHCIRHNVDVNNHAAVETALSDIRIHFEIQNARTSIYLNGEEVETDIRSNKVNELVSPVSTISAVRREMVRQQRILGEDKGLVMDGRDIGTVVFPDAKLKIFLTAKPEIRVKRRFDELVAKGQNPDLADVRQNILTRDHIDSTRSDSPLKQATDAIVLDNSNLTKAEQLAMALVLVRLRERA